MSDYHARVEVTRNQFETREPILRIHLTLVHPLTRRRFMVERFIVGHQVQSPLHLWWYIVEAYRICWETAR